MRENNKLWVERDNRHSSQNHRREFPAIFIDHSFKIGLRRRSSFAEDRVSPTIKFADDRVQQRRGRRPEDSILLRDSHHSLEKLKVEKQNKGENQDKEEATAKKVSTNVL